ncbi:excisionase family DNA-binding protein [Companilactobacillus hulinensis]|uniref:excisionase family DNA-binding protein n=1 Tax=Companilactobacillus hulinensis TaxID=2486007 RepID=UPI000F775704|nr:excisionase family DNA-binding protein [Companilactobacillus hulinensis]
MELKVNVPDTLDQHIQDLVQQTVTEMLKDVQHGSKYNDYLNLGQAANYLSISRGTLNKVIEQYNIPVTMIGNATRIKKTDLDTYMKKQAI